MNDYDVHEEDMAEILRLATEARVDRQRWNDYMARAGAIARRIGIQEQHIEYLPLLSALRAEIDLRRTVVRSIAGRRPGARWSELASLGAA
jgi:hypothetical protein